MCARVTLATPQSVLQKLFDFADRVEARARYNIAPSQEVLTVRARPEGGREARSVRWGVSGRGGAPVINARSETAAQKPLFRDALRHRRCVVLADGFFEWRQEGRARQPFLFRLADGGPFGLAALWEPPRAGTGAETCVLLTTQANALVGELHDRMPVIVPPERVGEWLNPAVEDPAALQGVLVPFPAERMRMRPVSERLNDPRNEGPELLDPPAQRSLF